MWNGALFNIFTLFGALGMLFASSNMDAHADEATAGIVPVYSTYKDEKSDRLITIKGAGTLIQDGDRFFILTAAHVSQGTFGLRVEIDGKPAEILGRRADNRHDLELIETGRPKPETGVFAAYDPSCDCYLTKGLAWVYRIGPQIMKMGYQDPDGVAYCGYTCTQYELIIPPWSPSRPESSSANGSVYGKNFGQKTEPIFTVDSGLAMYSQSTLIRGMSGAPIVSYREKPTLSVPQLAGVALSFHRFHKGTSFASAQAIATLRRDYLGQAPSESVQWHLESGAFFRTYPDGTREIRSPSDHSGNFLMQDSGNGTSAEGGNGTSVEGGNGTSAEGGGSVRALRNWGKTKPQPFEVIYQGKPSGGFQIRDPQGRLHLLSPDAESLNFIQRNRGKSCSIEALSAGVSLLDTLVQRSDPGSLASGSRVEGSLDRFLSATAIPRFARHMGASLELKERKLVIRFWAKQRATFFRKEWESNFELVLDEKGIPLGSNQKDFFPIVEVRDPETGDVYEVDLQDLFFDRLVEPWAGASSLQWSGVPQLRVIRKKPKDEDGYETPFFFGPLSTKRPNVKTSTLCEADRAPSSLKRKATSRLKRETKKR
ncbi:MAG: hypothetical protein NDJ90_09955 [Oligoflexia bacterium]|nr:hypothetical protein [Oligoflexia bacterium]